MFEQLQRGINRAWDQLADGWEQLRDRATSALTRFNPVNRGGQVEAQDDYFAKNSSRWSLLAADVREDNHEVIVRLELPGMEKENIEIEVMDKTLVVSGEKRLQRERQEGAYHLMECAYGSFQRVIPLPVAVDNSQGKASYEQGVLRIALPKTETAQRRRIEVKSA